MKSTGRLALALWIALAGCSEPERGSVVALDHAWNVDFARNACTEAAAWHKENAGMISRFGCERLVSCKPMTTVAKACQRDPELQVREFEAALGAQFAQMEPCRSIRLVDAAGAQEKGKAARQAKQKEYWNLSVDFYPGALKQEWTMIHAAEQVSVINGEGEPGEIAVDVCAAVRASSAD